MNPFKGRHFQRDIILWAVRWYWRNPSGFCSWHLDETYIRVIGRWAYLYRAVDSKGRTIDFLSFPAPQQQSGIPVSGYINFNFVDKNEPKGLLRRC